MMRQSPRQATPFAESGPNTCLASCWLHLLVREATNHRNDGLPACLVEAAGKRRAVLPVYFGKGDASGVPSGAFDSLAGLQLACVAESPPHIHSAYAVSRQFHPEIKGLLAEALRKMAGDESGRLLLNLLHVREFCTEADSTMDGTMKMIDTAERPGWQGHQSNGEEAT
jgi:hypothetical protein